MHLVELSKDGRVPKGQKQELTSVLIIHPRLSHNIQIVSRMHPEYDSDVKGTIMHIKIIFVAGVVGQVSDSSIWEVAAKAQKTKIILGYIMRSRVVWAT